MVPTGEYPIISNERTNRALAASIAETKRHLDTAEALETLEWLMPPRHRPQTAAVAWVGPDRSTWMIPTLSALVRDAEETTGA